MTERKRRRCLLISNSTAFGEGYLDHCAEEMLRVLGEVRRIGFVPFAIADYEGYGRRAEERFARMGVETLTLTTDDRGRTAAAEIPAVFVGGGNTFRLLHALQHSGLAALLGRRASDDMIYMGASAGANIAAPTIKTTNDMPIVEPASFSALNLVGFQINPHYLDPQPDSQHMGETREQRLTEFHEENATPVVGLREGAWLRVAGKEIHLGGRSGARIFRQGREPVEMSSGARLDDLESD